MVLVLHLATNTAKIHPSMAISISFVPCHTERRGPCWRSTIYSHRDVIYCYVLHSTHYPLTIPIPPSTTAPPAVCHAFSPSEKDSKLQRRRYTKVKRIATAWKQPTKGKQQQHKHMTWVAWNSEDAAPWTRRRLKSFVDLLHLAFSWRQR